MSENTGNKKRPSSKKPSNGQKSGSKSKRPRPSGSSGAKGSGVNPHKKNKLAGKTVEMSSGRQISIDEVVNEPETPSHEAHPEQKKNQNTPEPKADDTEKTSGSDEEESEGGFDGPDIGEQISWKKQLSSIVIWMFSVILLALTFFPGESLWTVIHGFILGILGFKAFLWAGLLVYLGYLMTKQRNEFTVMNIIRPTAGIIVLTDVLGYILVQSNGYRNVYNELTFSILQLIGQIFRDGSKIGGTGLLGGSIGEILIGIAGKNGAAIITSIMLTAMIMVLSHTGPIELFEQTKRKIRWFLQPEHALRKPAAEDAVYGQKTVFQEEDFFDDGIDVDVDGLIEAESAPGQAETVDVDIDNEQPADEGEKSDLEDIVNKVSLKKKKKLTKAEEIQAQSEVISKQVESGENNSDAGEKEYKFPVTRLLVSPKNSGTSEDLKQELIETADKLIRTLEEYGVKASIHDISHGPTVTRYEIKPAPGVKINKIKNLSADIALRLAAQSIRIEAPIPGKAAVGIEIPNQNKQMVRIREIIGSKEFAEAKGSLVVALGKDIEGNIVLCDLTKMPHLLIAGSTGSGKSVCVNSMLISMLYKYSPADVRMVLIDPKSVEFDMYNGIPHLLVPVVCEPKKAAGALQWAVSEMLKRYSMLKERGARNIDGYNRIAEQTHEFEKLCRIVIVIDEMADLMIASPKEVEDAIARLAAMARAAGMYMVLATQRPSVDVITGTIKNNIPSRIALAVSSQIDSRTILDEGGAENLIGYGDMLFHPMGSSKHIRVQGCFVEDFEVERVINFVKQNGLAEYDDSIADEIERNSLDNSGESSAEFEGKDEFFEKAVEVVTEAGQASTSMLQRRLGVGYARAGRIIDQLEEHGIIGPHEGSKPRAVLLSRTQWLEMTMSRSHAGKNDPLLRNNSGFAAQTLDSGHEEISARQSEFFNADNSDEFDYEDEFEQEILSVSNTPESDGGIIVPEEEESDGEPAAESGSDSPETATDDAPDSFSVEQEEKEDRTVKGRDMSIFMEDVYDASDDLFDVADQSEIAEPSSVPGTESDVDIPPWEEIPEEPVRNKSSENVFVEDDTDDFAAFGEPEHIISVEDKNKAVITEDTDEEEDDNDDGDFILFSEPEKETPAKSGRKSVILDSEDDDDDLHAFSEPDRNPPAKKPPVRNDMLANGNDNADHDDDDLFDDILSSSWIKKL